MKNFATLICLNTLMKVVKQRNTYYVDLHKKIYRGYVELTIDRNLNEDFLVFKSDRLIIQKIQLLGKECLLYPIFANSKDSAVQSSTTNIVQNNGPNLLHSNNGPSSNNIDAFEQPCGDNCVDSSVSYNDHKFLNKDKIFSTDNSLDYDNSEKLSDQIINKEETSFEKIDLCKDKWLKEKSFIVEIPEDFEKKVFDIRIEFFPHEKNHFLQWYAAISPKDKHKELISINRFNDSSGTAPFIDDFTETELIFVVPNTDDVKVASSGKLVSIKEEDKNIIYLFKHIGNPKFLAFAVGSFEQIDLFNDCDKKKLLLPSINLDYSEIQSDAQSIIRFIDSFVKSEAFSSISLVFSMIDIENIVASDIIILKANLIGTERDIEPCYKMKKILSDCLSLIVFRLLNWNPVDLWICYGFAGYLSDYCIKNILGNNEFMYLLKKDRDYIFKNDIIEPPIFFTERKKCSYYSKFYRAKSKLIFHCLESNLSYAFLQKIAETLLEIKNAESELLFVRSSRLATPLAAEIIKEKQISCIIDNPVESIASSTFEISKRENFTAKSFTPRFIKIIKDATGKDLKSIFDFYLFRPGLIKVKLQLNINKKKTSVKVEVSQTPTSLLNGANKKYFSNFMIKSYETEGIFEHQINQEGENIFSYHTKPKKKKKEDEEAEEEDTMPLLYILADPKRESILQFDVEQPDYMYIEQLNDKNVISQIEAIEALQHKPTPLSCEALERLLDNSHSFYKVRIKAIYAIRNIFIERFDGIQCLIQYFIRTRCVPNSTILKSNEFGLINYFIQFHLVKAISLNQNVNIESNKTIVSFLQNILKFNDNSLSQFIDSGYISLVISRYVLMVINYFKLIGDETKLATAEVFHESRIKDSDFFFNPSPSICYKPKIKNIEGFYKDFLEKIKHCLEEIERFRIMDMVFPSTNNVISVSCLSSLLQLAFLGVIKINMDYLKHISLYPNIFSIRLLAIKGLMVLFPESFSFVFKNLINETPFFVSSALNILVKLLESDAKFNKNCLKASFEFIINLEWLHNKHIFIQEAILKIKTFLQNKQINLEQYRQSIIKSFNFSREEETRNYIMKTIHRTKTIKLVDFEGLREKLLLTEHIIRLPKVKRPIIKIVKEPPKFSYKIRLKYNKYVPKNIDGIIFKLKLPKKKIKYKREDIPLLIVSKIREHHSTAFIDDFIKKSKPRDSFDWSPMISKKIFDIARSGEKLKEIYELCEKMLVFVLSFSTPNGKIYFNAKVVFNLLERAIYQYAHLPTAITPFDEVLRKKCEEFVDNLLSNEYFEAFYEPVNYTELKNYLDIVRVPMCLGDVKSKIGVYETYECFIAELERIYINCLNYNNAKSLIAMSAKDLKDKIEEFKCKLELPSKKDTYEVLKDILKKANEDGHLDQLIENIKKFKTFGDLDNELNNIKKKYSRYSTNGKTCVKIIREVRSLLASNFGVENGRLFFISD